MKHSLMKHSILSALFITFNIVLSSARVSNTPLFEEVNLVTYEAADTSKIFIPNVFTPNGDGLNDLFNPSGNFTQLEMKIYNRHGQLIYNSIQLNEGWNGRTTTGSNCTEGTYFYLINTDGNASRGQLTLLR